jgi:tight adherence protein B
VRRSLLVAIAALAVAAPAGAGVRIGGVDTSGYPKVRLTVVAAAQPRIRENGLPVVGAQTANLGRAKSVVLAVDRSESMKGQSLRDATSAARAFVAAKGSNDRIEVIAFGRQALALTKFSSSGVDADAALAALGADTRSGTALWDAVVRCAAAVAHEDQPGHVIIVVTDGRDVSSRATLDEAVAAAQRARAAVYAIGIAGPDFTPAPLRELAARTGGAYLEAQSTAELAALYARIGRALAHTWQITYLTAARPGDKLELRAAAEGVSAPAHDVVIQSSGLDRSPAPQPPSALPRGVWRSSAAPAVLALAVGALFLLAVWFAMVARTGTWLTQRIAPHLGTPEVRGRVKRRRQGQSLRKSVVAATEQAFTKFGQFRALQRLLTRADLPLLAAELLYICLGAGFVPALLAGVAGAPAAVAVLMMLIGFASPICWATYRARKRMKAFDNQLPDLLITIAASLKAGHSFRHAIQAVVDEGADPAAKEFRRVLTETRLGRPMDQALAEMGERVGSKNLTFVLNSVTIQRQIGGSLAGLFDMVAETVRQRQQFARKIRSLTAMGRMSAYVLGGLPFAMAFLISLISPPYMGPLWHTGIGHDLVIVSLVMLGFGGLVLRKIVSFKG